MRTVYKYSLRVRDVTAVEMPAGAHILDVQAQGGALTLWALVDTDALPEQRHFRVVGTGHRVPDLSGAHYLGTVQMPDGLVWHLFEMADAGIGG